MSFSFIFQLLINGIIAGAIYSLISSGFSLIYNTNKFINFSHGAVIVLSAYFAYIFFNIVGLPFMLAAGLSITTTIFFGLFVMKFVYNPLRKKGASNAVLLIASVAILIMIENILLLLFGATVKKYPLFDASESIEFAGAIITKLEIIIVLSSLLLLAFLYIFLKKSNFGKKLQAISDEPHLAESIGIPSKKLQAFAIALASLIAGIAGILIGLEYKIEPSMGTRLMISGFSGAVVGGVSTVLGSILGAFIVGILENLGIGFLPSAYKNAISFILLFVFLLLKPSGLFGKKEEKL